MRTLAMMLAAAALSWTHVAWAQDAKQERREAMDATREQAKEEAAGAQQTMDREAQQTREEMRQETARTEKASRWEGKSNFDVEGKISKVGRDSITLTREDLPAATLKVSKETKIELDGNAASINQLRQGQDVKASFNLEGDKPLAVEIKAEKAEQ
jgi:hypothetical protein